MDIPEAERIIGEVRALADRWGSATIVGVLSGEEQPDLVTRGFAEQLRAVLPGGSIVESVRE